MVFPLLNSLPLFLRPTVPSTCSSRQYSLFSGFLTHRMGNSLIYVETTGFQEAGHAVETMDAESESLSSPVKIYLDEIIKFGNYVSILP